MRYALDLAHQAQAKAEVPVGAIVVHDNQIIGSGFNSSISLQDPTAHAEIMAIRAASSKINNYRLVNTSLYVTLEPCAMCAGALIHARVANLIFATRDPKAGAIASIFNLGNHPQLNHQIATIEGVLQEECSHLLKTFFKKRRS